MDLPVGATATSASHDKNMRSQLGALISGHDWAATPLGASPLWPQPLKTLVDVMLGSNQPMFVAWGAERTLLYNDAYAEILAAKHPLALGQDFLEVWSEIRADLVPIVEEAYAGGAVQMDDIKLLMQRRGYLEETHFSFSYTPVRDEAGSVVGFFCPCIETTEQVLAEQRRAADAERQRRLFEQAPGFITILKGPEHVFEFANAAYRRLFGDRNYVGRSVREAFPELRDQDFFKLLDQVYVSGERFVAESTPIRLETAEGVQEQRFLDFIYEPVTSESGEVTGIFVEGHDVTEARLTESALRNSEARYRTLFDSIQSGFCVVEVDLQALNGRTDYRVVEANPAFYEHTGFPEAITHQWLREAAPELEEHWYEKYGRVARTGMAERFELGSDHLNRWFDVFAFPAGTPEERRVGILFNDISSRRQAEEQLRESEARLRELNDTLEQRVEAAVAERQILADVVENATASILVCDLDFNILAINRTNVDQFERIYGSRPKPGDNFIAEVPTDEERSRISSEFEKVLDGDEHVVVQEFGAPGHERVAYEVRLTPLRDGDGVQFGLVSTAYDVSERVRTEARLAEAEAARREADALYRAYFENTPEALFLIRVGPDGYYVEQINAAHEAGLGFKQEEVQGKRIDQILPAEIAQRVIDTYDNVVKNGGVYQYREVYDLSGSPQHWDTSLVPMSDESGRIVRLIGSSRNVTAQVFAEEALRHSQKMEAMGSLTGGVAHDFNNLLTPIIGSLDMLQRKGGGDERQHRLIGGALQSAERAKTLVQRLLAFARRQPLQPVAVDVSKLISGMAELVSSTTGPQIKVVVDSQEDLAAAKADPNQLEMAVLNLSVNARDAMPEGGTLRISARSEKVMGDNPHQLNPGTYVVVSVADTGTGMDEGTLQRAVEPFFSTKGVGQGTGLGLSMAHGLAAQLGGALTIRSNIGLGTNVEIWLPESPTGAAPALGSDVMDGPANASGHGTVLLVDDESLVRSSTADMLLDLGYAVEEAESAEQALRLVDQNLEFDLLITDHLMPGMTGTQLADEIRTRWPGKPLIVISGYAQNDGIAPDVPRLTKPFRQAELAAKIAEVTS